MSWRPDQQTQETIKGMVDALFAVAPDVLGIDEFIAGCEVSNMDLYGVGVGVYPRYIQCDIKGYQQPVFYRGGLATLAVGDDVTVVHIRDGELYEVAGPSGATGTAGLTGTGLNTQVTYWTGPNAIAGDAGMTYIPATDTLTLAGGLTLTGGANAVLTVNDNVASAMTLVDAGGLEYLRVDSQNAQPQLHYNIAGGDIDYRWESVGVDPALFIRGSDGLIGMGTATLTGDLTIAGTDGVDINPGSDQDVDMITVGVTGAPGLWWDESVSSITFTQNVNMAGNRIWMNVTPPAGSPGLRMRWIEADRGEFGWSGTGGANMEFYSSGHGARPGSFWVVYGGGALIGDYRMIHYNGVGFNAAFKIDHLGYVSIGKGTVAAARLLDVRVDDAVTNATSFVERLGHITSGTAAANFGMGIEHELEDAGGTNRIATTIETYWTNALAANFSSAYEINVSSNTAMLEMVRMNGLNTQPVAVWNNGEADVDFRIAASGITNAVFVRGSDGNVGINIAAPAAKLHIDNDGALAQAVAYFDQGDVSEEMFEFATTIGVGNAIEAVGAKTLTTTHFVKCTIPGPLTVYFPVGTIA